MELNRSLPLFTALVVLVGAFRLFELSLSKRNRRRLGARGAEPVKEKHFRAMVVLHTSVLLGSLVEAWLVRRPIVPVLAVTMLAVVVAASLLRWWVIATLGAHWNVAIMDSVGDQVALGVVTDGPYRFIRHPNYVAVFLELAALPLVHTAWITASLGTAAHIWVLYQRIRAEEAVLLAHPTYRREMAQKPRFLPGPIRRPADENWLPPG